MFGRRRLSLFAFTLVWGLIRLDGMHSSPLLSSLWPFLVAAVSLAAFVAGELRIEHPMVVAFIFFLTLYLQNALRFDALQTGIHLLPMTVMVWSAVSRRTISKRNGRCCCPPCIMMPRCSGGLQQAPTRIKDLPIFPEISHQTRAAWIESFGDTMRVAALFIAAGAVVAAITIRKEDVR